MMLVKTVERNRNRTTGGLLNLTRTNVIATCFDMETSTKGTMDPEGARLLTYSTIWLR